MLLSSSSSLPSYHCYFRNPHSCCPSSPLTRIVRMYMNIYTVDFPIIQRNCDSSYHPSQGLGGFMVASMLYSIVTQRVRHQRAARSWQKTSFTPYVPESLKGRNKRQRRTVLIKVPSTSCKSCRQAGAEYSKSKSKCVWLVSVAPYRPCSHTASERIRLNLVLSTIGV